MEQRKIILLQLKDVGSTRAFRKSETRKEVIHRHSYRRRRRFRSSRRVYITSMRPAIRWRSLETAHQVAQLATRFHVIVVIEARGDTKINALQQLVSHGIEKENLESLLEDGHPPVSFNIACIYSLSGINICEDIFNLLGFDLEEDEPEDDPDAENDSDGDEYDHPYFREQRRRYDMLGLMEEQLRPKLIVVERLWGRFTQSVKMPSGAIGHWSWVRAWAYNHDFRYMAVGLDNLFDVQCDVPPLGYFDITPFIDNTAHPRVAELAQLWPTAVEDYHEYIQTPRDNGTLDIDDIVIVGTVNTYKVAFAEHFFERCQIKHIYSTSCASEFFRRQYVPAHRYIFIAYHSNNKVLDKLYDELFERDRKVTTIHIDLPAAVSHHLCHASNNMPDAAPAIYGKEVVTISTLIDLPIIKADKAYIRADWSSDDEPSRGKLHNGKSCDARGGCYYCYRMRVNAFKNKKRHPRRAIRFGIEPQGLTLRGQE